MVYTSTTDDGNIVWTYFDGKIKQRFTSENAEAEARAAERIAEQEAKVAERPTPPQEWEGLLRNTIDQSQIVVKSAGELSTFARYNSISEAIAAAESGQFLEGTTIKKEDAQARSLLFIDLGQWLSGHVNDDPALPTREELLFRRF